jgi:hypothetical protein
MAKGQCDTPPCYSSTNSHTPQVYRLWDPAPISAPWRMNGKWWGNSFLFAFSSLANHGGYLSWFGKQPLHMYKASTSLVLTYFCSYLPTYLPTYVWDLFPTELITKMKPNINSVEVHPQLSNNHHPVDGVLVGAGSVAPSLRFRALVMGVTCMKVGAGWRFTCSN